MDDARFDRLARLLGAAGTRRGALAGLLGGLLGGAGFGSTAAAGAARDRRDDADASGRRRRRRKCDPPCGANFECLNGRCHCPTVNCGAACCPAGQVCQNGACAEVVSCHAYGRACGDSIPCCDGLVCASGQGGKTDVACYVPAGGSCTSTAECVYDSTCKDGACVANPQPTPTATPGCTGTIPVTGNRAVDGEALRALAEDPAGPATIVLCAGTYQASQEIVIARDLTITAAPDAGGEVVLDGGWSGDQATDGHRVIRVNFDDADVTVTLEGITLRNGRTDDHGGCVNAQTTSATNRIVLTLNKVRVSACGAGGAGGGIYMQSNNADSLLALVDSEISGNSAITLGGGIYCNTTGRFHASGCTVAGNSCGTGCAGGGMYLWVTGGATIDGNSVIGGSTLADGNRAALGGGVFVRGGTLTVEDTTVSSNDAHSNEGGGVYLRSGTVTLGGSTRVTNNQTAVAGGGLYILGGTLNLSGAAKIDGNRAVDGPTAGFRKNGSAVVCSGTPKVCANPTSGADGCSGVLDSSCSALCAPTC